MPTPPPPKSTVTADAILPSTSALKHVPNEQDASASTQAMPENTGML